MLMGGEVGPRKQFIEECKVCEESCCLTKECSSSEDGTESGKVCYNSYTIKQRMESYDSKNNNAWYGKCHRY